MASIAPHIIRSLTKEQALEIAKRYGPPALLYLQQLLNGRREGKAWEKQGQTFEQIKDALPQLLQDIQTREIKVVPQAFNSTPTFVEYFQTAALGTITLALLDIARSIRRVGASLEAIQSELAISNVAKVQGWDEGGFGAYVHRFVGNEMAAVRGQKHQFFYLWHPDTDWYPAFEGSQTANPLGPTFGGYHHDLATICLRMSSDRRALIATTDYGHAAVFHLIIPAYYPLVIDRPVTFAQELLPLVITGVRHRGTDLVWFALRQRLEGLHLNHVSILRESGNWAIEGGVWGSFGSCFGMAGCATASIAFPPCAPVAGTLAATFYAAGVGSSLAAGAGIVYDAVTRETDEVLGNPIFLG